MKRNRLRGRRRMRMLEELYKKEFFCIMKRRAEDQILWNSWMP